MSLAEKYIREGHPSVDELIAEQGAVFPRNPEDLLGEDSSEESVGELRFGQLAKRVI